MANRLPGRLVTIVLVALSLLAVSAADAQNKFRLKPGAAGKVCVDCHTDFAEKLKSKFVHTPVKTGDCTGCHSPHTSAHGKLLSAPTGSICLTCHGDLIPAKTLSTHKVVIEGGCVKCHDPHASSNKANLSKAGNELCVSCHKTIGEAAEKAKFKHMPVSGGCLNCHDPHASSKAPRLLKSPVPTLCVQCHKPDSPSFTKQHVDYPVARANCVSCHDPHGSNTAGILFDTVHPPVASKRCNQCHNAAASAEPFATRRPGFELCRGCHAGMVNETLSKRRVHWPVLDRTGCLSCHGAHASRAKKLLKADEASLCGQCHKDTLDWQARLVAKDRQEKAAAKGGPERGALTHQPVQTGSCTSCHMPHASDSAFLLGRTSVVELCGGCHDWLHHNSHPMGEKVVDPRNKNRTVDCLSCHRSHGTGNRYIITFPTSTELCVQCHQRLRR
jgi:predicted CXXCH cytochrome family protein